MISGAASEVTARRRRRWPTALGERLFEAEPDSDSSNRILATRELRRPLARDRTFSVVFASGSPWQLLRRRS